MSRDGWTSGNRSGCHALNCNSPSMGTIEVNGRKHPVCSTVCGVAFHKLEMEISAPASMATGVNPDQPMRADEDVLSQGAYDAMARRMVRDGTAGTGTGAAGAAAAAAVAADIVNTDAADDDAADSDSTDDAADAAADPDDVSSRITKDLIRITKANEDYKKKMKDYTLGVMEQ
jgi:hypothetical protein